MAKLNRRRRPSTKSELAPTHGPPGWPMNRVLWTLLGVVALICLAGGVVFYVFATMASKQFAGTAMPPASFVGSETCAGCHQAEAKLWHTSQHKHAMDHATEKSVLGDFSNVSFDYYGVRSRFFRQDGKFLVETDGPDGKLATFEVKYTFGVDPLQQYLDRIS